MRWFLLFSLALVPITTAAAGPGAAVKAEAKAAKKAARQAAKEEGKVVIEDGVARYSGQPVAGVVADPMQPYSFTITDLDGTERLYLRWVQVGPFDYFEGYRAEDLGTIAFDTESFVGYKKWLIENLALSGVLTPEGWDEAAYERFAAKTGTRQTELRKQALILIPGNAN